LTIWTGFIQCLQQRKDDEGLDFNWVSDDDGSIDKCFFVFKNAVKQFSSGCRPVLFDTKHGSNRYGLRLGLFTTVGRNGDTIILSGSLLQHEDTDSFMWLFNQFKLFLGMQPKCMLTDGDKAMAAAIHSALPETRHLLCTWHLSQTLIKNTKGWFSGPGAGKAFYNFYGAWWELCKISDVHFKQVFDAEYDKWLQLVPEAHRESVWLRRYIYNTRQMWCYSWTWEFSTLGCHSTQRSESIHSVVGSLLQNQSTLIEVIVSLQNWANTKQYQAQSRFYRFCSEVATGNMQQGRLVQGMMKSFSEHAIKLVTANLHRSIEYFVEPVADNDTTFKVFRHAGSVQSSFLGPVQWVNEVLTQSLSALELNNVSTAVAGRMDRASHVHDFFPLFRDCFFSDGEVCSCQYPTMQGLPCEHNLAVLVIKKQAVSLPSSFLNSTTWQLESDATDSEFHAWCVTLLASRTHQTITPTKLAVSNSGTRFAALMVTAKMVAQGIFTLHKLIHTYTFTLLHFYTFTLLHFYTFTLLHFYTFTLLTLFT
jgi:hypothetical protein